MTTFHERDVTKSRKRRRCDWCSEYIEIGEPYHAYRWADGSDTGAVEMHPECLAASHRYFAENSFEDFFEPHENSRGCCCERGRCKCVKEAGVT